MGSCPCGERRVRLLVGGAPPASCSSRCGGLFRVCVLYERAVRVIFFFLATRPVVFGRWCFGCFEDLKRDMPDSPAARAFSRQQTDAPHHSREKDVACRPASDHRCKSQKLRCIKDRRWRLVITRIGAHCTPAPPSRQGKKRTRPEEDPENKAVGPSKEIVKVIAQMDPIFRNRAGTGASQHAIHMNS